MVHQVLQRFGFQYSSPQLTPLSTSHSLSAPPSDESAEPSGPYPELVRCLMYLMTCTRPDLAYPLSLLARHVAPGRHPKVHWDAVKRVLRYLCSTSGMGLVLGERGPVVLTGHAYASWVDDLATQWSSQGYTFSLATTTPRHPTLRKPLTKLLGRRGLAPTLLLLPLATARTYTLSSSSPTATTPIATTTATPNAATTASTRIPTPATTPTIATTSSASTTSTAAPTTTPAVTAPTPATFSLADVALRTSRSSLDVLSTRDVNSSSRCVGGGKVGGGAHLKEGRAQSATSKTYSNYTSLSCKEMLLEYVNSEDCGVK
ncbi:unnamed protein product [Closterium sp. NIES-54]